MRVRGAARPDGGRRSGRRGGGRLRVEVVERLPHTEVKQELFAAARVDARLHAGQHAQAGLCLGNRWLGHDREVADEVRSLLAIDERVPADHLDDAVPAQVLPRARHVETTSARDRMVSPDGADELVHELFGVVRCCERRGLRGRLCRQRFCLGHGSLLGKVQPPHIE